MVVLVVNFTNGISSEKVSRTAMDLMLSLLASLTHYLMCHHNNYPNINILLQIMCTLPVTSCSSERSFSALKQIKTSLRSSMGNERLTALTLLYIHRDVEIDIEEVKAYNLPYLQHQYQFSFVLIVTCVHEELQY